MGAGLEADYRRKPFTHAGVRNQAPNFDAWRHAGSARNREPGGRRGCEEDLAPGSWLLWTDHRKVDRWAVAAERPNCAGAGGVRQVVCRCSPSSATAVRGASRTRAGSGPGPCRREIQGADRQQQRRPAMKPSDAPVAGRAKFGKCQNQFGNAWNRSCSTWSSVNDLLLEPLTVLSSISSPSRT